MTSVKIEAFCVAVVCIWLVEFGKKHMDRERWVGGGGEQERTRQ